MTACVSINLIIYVFIIPRTICVINIGYETFIILTCADSSTTTCTTSLVSCHSHVSPFMSFLVAKMKCLISITIATLSICPITLISSFKIITQLKLRNSSSTSATCFKTSHLKSNCKPKKLHEYSYSLNTKKQIN